MTSHRILIAATALWLLAPSTALGVPPLDRPESGSPPAEVRSLSQAGLRATVVAPANDELDAAVVATPLPFVDDVDTRHATRAADDPVSSCAFEGATVWYAITPVVATAIAVDTLGSDYDTTLSVWTGSRGALSEVTCNDDAAGLTSKVSFNATPGATYYVLAGAYGGGSGGRLVLTVREFPPAPNDDFDTPVSVPGLPSISTLDTKAATSAADDPSCAGNAASVWYAYTAPVATRVTADATGSDYDVALGVYTGSRGALAQVGCGPGRVNFAVAAGTTYYLMAAGASGGGELVLALDVATPVPQFAVRATRAFEVTPAAGPEHLAWAQASGASRYWTLYMQPAGESRARVNPRRTHGFSGGFEGSTLVYQEVRGGNSDLVRYRVDTRTRSALPAGVNTRRWEWHPTISGDWLLFSRRNFRTGLDEVLLRNLVTGEAVVLDRLSAGPRRIGEAGQVSGNYAVWYRCTPRCDVFLYDIAAQRTIPIPNPDGAQQYDPSVTPDGTVYFLRSGRRCGASVKLVRDPLHGPARVLTPLGRGFDSFHTYARANPDGTASVFYERLRCGGGVDVYGIVDP